MEQIGLGAPANGSEAGQELASKPKRHRRLSWVEGAMLRQARGCRIAHVMEKWLLHGGD